MPKTRGYPQSPNKYMQPTCQLQRAYLIFNDSLYGLLIAFLLAGFTVCLTNTLLSPGPFIWHFIFGPCIIPFFHPAHGRYIFALLPIMIYAASYLCESLMKLWREGSKKETAAVYILTCLFFIWVML